MAIPISSIWAIVIALFGLVLTVINIVDKLMQFHARSQEPDRIQNERIEKLEEDVSLLGRKITDQFQKYDEYFSKDRQRLDDIEMTTRKANTVIIKSLQALTANALDGNNVEALRESKRELDDYLLTR